MLTLLGYYTGLVDGVYQETTQAAVAQFQQAAGLVPDGVVGPATWSLLLPLTPAQASPPQPVQTAAAPPITAVEAPVTAVETSLTGTEAPAATTETAEVSLSSPNPEELPNLSSPIPDPAVESAAPTTPAAPQTPDPSPEDDGVSSSPVELPTLKRGMNGSAIVQLQERLQALGIYSGAVDGVFGPETESAVIQAQQTYGLQPDGIVGPATWRAILR